MGTLPGKTLELACRAMKATANTNKKCEMTLSLHDYHVCNEMPALVSIREIAINKLFEYSLTNIFLRAIS